MLGYLIYHSEEAIKNKRFIQMFQEEGKKSGIEFKYVNNREYKTCKLPDIVINRTRDYFISAWYEKNNVKVFHDALITKTGNNKMATLQYLYEHLPDEIKRTKWCPNSCLISEQRIEEWIDNIELLQKKIQENEKNKGEISCKKFISEFQKEIISSMQRLDLNQLSKSMDGQKDFIIKTLDGHGGLEVSLLSLDIKENAEKSICQLKETLLKYRKKVCIIQERMESKSKDVRIYIVGNKIYAAVLRQGKNDFRSNYSLGGSVCQYEISKEKYDYVQIFLNAFKKHDLAMAGMDFIITSDNELVFNELEEMVGCRMLYQVTNYNIVQDYIKWIKKQLS